jgi:hypothetical protein
VFFAFFFLFLSAGVHAATWYVCPDVGPSGEDFNYGTEDGASVANCFDGFSRAWGSGRINPNDTLLVVSDFGPFYERNVISNSGANGLPIRIMGWSSSRSEPAIATIETSVPINGYQSFSGSTTYRTSGYGWSRVSGEIFKKISHAVPQLLSEDGKYLTPILGHGRSEAQIVAGLGRGQYAVVPGVPNVIYYRSSDGVSPFSHMVRMNDHRNDGAPGAIFCDNQHDVEIRYLRVRMVYIGYAQKATRNAGLVLSNCSNVTVDSLEAETNFIGIGINGGANIVFGRSVVASRNLAAGISLEAIPFDISTVVVSGVYQYNNRDPAVSGDARSVGHVYDGDGISIGQAGGIIRDVEVRNATVSYNGAPDGDLRTGGSGIYLGTSAALAAELSITGSLIEFNHGCGIHLGGQWGGGKVVSNVIRENVRGQNTGTCLSNVWVDSSTTSSFRRSVIANNNFIGNHGARAISFNNANSSNTLEFRNNIFAYNIPYFASPSKVADIVIAVSSHDNVIESNNIVFPTVGAAIFRGRAFSCQQVNSGEWARISANTGDGTKCSDPMFDFHPNSASPAVLGGACYALSGCAEMDFLGKPANSPPDIGAFQR